METSFVTDATAGGRPRRHHRRQPLLTPRCTGAYAFLLFRPRLFSARAPLSLLPASLRLLLHWGSGGTTSGRGTPMRCATLVGQRCQVTRVIIVPPPRVAQFVRNQANFGGIRPIFVKSLPDSAEVAPNLAASTPNLADIGPEFVDFGPIFVDVSFRAKLAQIRSNAAWIVSTPDQVRPMPVEFAPNLPNIVRLRACSAQILSMSAHIRPNFSDSDRMWPEFVRHRLGFRAFARP